MAKKFDLRVIEDATESLGATYHGRSLGCLGDIACFSFNGNKIVTTGGGGMLLTDNEDWARRAKYLTTQAKDDPFESIHGEVGYNYRLTSILAAVGCAQMEQLDAFVAIKTRIAAHYSEAFQKVSGVAPMRCAPWARCTYWMYTILINEGEYQVDSRQLMRKLHSQKIHCRPLWQPMHKSPAHTSTHMVELPVAERLARQALSLPCSVRISETELNRVIAAVKG